MDQAVQDGIAEGGIADDFMPVLQGLLAGDQGGLPAVSILEDFEEIPTPGVGERSEAVVVEDEELRLLEAVQDPRIRSVGPGQSEFSEES